MLGVVIVLVFFLVIVKVWLEDIWCLGLIMKVLRFEIDVVKFDDMIFVVGGIGFFWVLRLCEVFFLVIN